MNVAALLRQRATRLLLLVAVTLLIVFQLSSLFAFLSSSLFSASPSSSPLSADYTRLVGELRADASTFSPQHAITWLLAVMHELPGETELENVKAALRVLRAAGVPDERVVLIERRARPGEKEQRDSLSSALGVSVLSLRRGSVHSVVQQYGEMLATVLSSALSEPDSSSAASSSLCALLPSHIRPAADLPSLFFHTARLLKVDSTLLASSASAPFSSLSLSSSWLPTAAASSSSAVASLLRSSAADLQLTSSLADADTALLLTAASFAGLSASIRSSFSSASSLPAALSSLSAGRSFLSPVVSRAVSLLQPASVRASERLSAVEGHQSVVAWPELARVSSVGYGHWLASLLPSCALLAAPDDVSDRRGECVVWVVPAASQSDAEWQLWLSNWLGAHPASSIESRYEAVGEWRGVVVLRYLTNLVLLVAPYSPFFSFVPSLSAVGGPSLEVQSVGCFRSSRSQPDLPYELLFLSARSLSPARCLNACVHRGFQYAGIEDGSLCRCGTAITASLSLNASSCTRRCSPSAALPDGPLSSASLSCGSVSAVSVYSDGGHGHIRYQREGPSASFVRGREGETCVAACERAQAGVCREELFPLLTCGSLRAVGYKAGQCVDAAQLRDEASLRRLHVSSAPYISPGSEGVVLGAARWYGCRAVPLPETGRACVCAA